MALQKSINQDTDFGTLATLAYAKVVQGNFSYVDKNAHLAVYVYLNQAARDAKKNPIDQTSYDIHADAEEAELDENGNVIKEAIPAFDALFGENALKANGVSALTSFYNWLKTLTKWQGWADA